MFVSNMAFSHNFKSVSNNLIIKYYTRYSNSRNFPDILEPQVFLPLTPAFENIGNHPTYNLIPQTNREAQG